MSLELAAKHIAAQGRGKDRNLVHMTDREVAGLQALAMSQGGSLTINPETGLPEAGFLDSLLPTIIGFGASALTGGAVNPMTIGLLTGVGTAAISGDLSKGLMAGLGAWGGAGLGAGLIGAGAPAGEALGAAADFSTPAQGMFTQTPVAQAVQAVPAAPTGAAPFDLSSMGTVGGGQAVQPAYTGNILAAPATPAAPAVPPTQAAQAIPTTTPAPSAADINAHSATRLARESMAPVTMPPVGDQLKAGLKAVAANPSDFMTMENAKYGLAAAAPALLAAPEQEEYKPDTERYVYSYDPGRVEDPDSTRKGGPSSELTYFNPIYTRTAAKGGLMALAEGGEVDNELIEYEYDPLTKTYKKKVTPVAASPVAPITTSTTSGSSQMTPLSKQTEAYLDWEANTSEGADAKEARMQGVSNLIGAVVPGASLAALAQGRNPMPGGLMANLKAAFVTPDTYAKYQQRSQYYPTAGMTPGSAGWSQAVNEQAASRMARQEGVGGSGSSWSGYADTGDSATASRYGTNEGSEQTRTLSAQDSDFANGGIAAYAKGRFLEGPGDGVSDSIPATINGTQPARLADGEFVVPARIVSELGNGSSKAGARKLYAMMDRIQKARGKTVGKGKVAANTKAEKYLPA